LKSDADFLASCSIIDYSLLLGEIVHNSAEATEEENKSLSEIRGVYFTPENKPYVIGVIDPLTGFK
jgi:hypothetical protein